MLYATDQVMRQHADQYPTGLHLIARRAAEYRSVEAAPRGIKRGTMEHENAPDGMAHMLVTPTDRGRSLTEPEDQALLTTHLENKIEFLCGESERKTRCLYAWPSASRSCRRRRGHQKPNELPWSA
jgi:plasmid stability protein